MDPAYADLVGEWAERELGNKARVWTVTRSADGSLKERIDPSFLALINQDRSLDDVIDLLLTAAAEQHVAETRVW
jgi:hypothetical protein